MILKMALIDDDVWKKSASFESLASSVKGQMDVHSCSELATLISSELPIDVTTAYMESKVVREDILSCMTKVENLTGLAFLSSTGHTVKSLASVAIEDRLPDITFIKLACTLVGSTIDSRIEQNPFDVQFCLRLPQSFYNPETGDLTLTSSDSPATGPIFAPPKPQFTLAFDAEASDEGEDSDNSDKGGDKNSNQSGRKSTVVSTPKEQMVSTPTPRMSRLVGNQSTKSLITSYFGDLDFLDNQDKFDGVFGKAPLIIGTRPASEINVSCMGRAQKYADDCLLDVFLDVCRQDYVGRVDINARKKLVHAICKNIADLLQVKKGAGGKVEELTPDALYASYIGVVAGFPEDASLWSLTLSSSYFSALSPSLRDKMEEEETFRMPSISGMGSKTKQLERLRTVRSAAVIAYKKLNDKRERMSKLMLELGRKRDGGHHQLEVGDQYNLDSRTSHQFRVSAFTSIRNINTSCRA